MDVQNFTKEYEIIASDTLKEVEDIITCKICFDLLQTPLQCKTCENCYCQICLFKWGNGCPMRCGGVEIIDYQAFEKANKIFTSNSALSKSLFKF